ncbi:hypothetical protein DVA43_02420 [Leclercia sp. W6]|uniref:hypothetical protein n=1 Tax=Leclercia sp. W6 TaxID=2282310 RepID=UPI000DF49E69|nr:hypothetical protein [Leclercia sp. W6]AXF58489.1 hypothetical protein DVA43_02420 [Leclercia sp. W6]
MIRAVLILLALMASAAHADTVERCRIIASTGDKVCEVRGRVVERCHTDSTGAETCRRYD